MNDSANSRGGKVSKIIIYHPNGYMGILYGQKSMSIYYNGSKVLHTGSRNPAIQSGDDLYEHLEEMPELMKILHK